MDEENYVLTCNKIESLLLGNDMKRIKVDSFKSTVDELSTIIAQLFSLDKNSFDIMCFGKLLESTKSLDSYGIYKGTILYLTKKLSSQVKHTLPSLGDVKDEQLAPLSPDDQTMCVALKTALLNPLFRRVLENLSDFEKRENLIAVNPELRNEPTLFGILSDPELLNSYINRNNIKRVLKRYPHFLEVATHVSATFLEELNSVNSVNNLGYRGALCNYSLDGASEDEEMDESETSSVSSTHTSNSNHRLSDSTSLSAMLMQAYQNRNQTNSGVITQDMLREALQTSTSGSQTSVPSSLGHSSRHGSESTSQSSSRSSSQTGSQQSVRSQSSSRINSQQSSKSSTRSSQSTAKTDELETPVTSSQPNAPTTSSGSSTSAQPPPPRSTAEILISLAPQLKQLRELGITDDIVAIQALEATNGDVQAAINIIFSDFN